MWRLTNLVLILLCLFGRAGPLFGSTQENQEKVPEQNKPPVAEQPLSCSDKSSPAFWDNLMHLPVQFINWQKKENILTGQFASPAIFSANQVVFRLLQEDKDGQGSFFEIDDEWEKEMSRKSFLKKIKQDFWVVSYLTINNEKVICEAHQFKTWQSLEISYAQGVKNYSVKVLEFWQNLRVTPVYFIEIRENRAFWLFLRSTDKNQMPEPNEGIGLANGMLVGKFQRFGDGSIGEVLDHDFFDIDPNCVFHIAERKDPRSIKIPKIDSPFTLGSLRIRAKPIDRQYFVKNAPMSPWLWICFYQKDYDKKALVMLRTLGLAPEENGNGNHENGKKLK